MPISPDRIALYPGGSIRSPEWLALRAFILFRAGNRCECCGVPNGLVMRGVGMDEGTYMLEDGATHDAETGAYLRHSRGSEYEGRFVRIILTIAHVDQNPKNNDPENLRAWCQMHHLRHDANQHAENARQSRRAKLATADLFA